jgi:hypothetical protein
MHSYIILEITLIALQLRQSFWVIPRLEIKLCKFIGAYSFRKRHGLVIPNDEPILHVSFSVFTADPVALLKRTYGSRQVLLVFPLDTQFPIVVQKYWISKLPLVKMLQHLKQRRKIANLI